MDEKEVAYDKRGYGYIVRAAAGRQWRRYGRDRTTLVEYYEKNGVHYLFFDELLEGHKTPIRNMLKLRNEKLEVRKRGPVSAELVILRKGK